MNKRRIVILTKLNVAQWQTANMDVKVLIIFPRWELVDENGEKVGEIDYIVDKTEIPDGVELGDEIEEPKYRACIHLAK